VLLIEKNPKITGEVLILNCYTRLRPDNNKNSGGVVNDGSQKSDNGTTAPERRINFNTVSGLFFVALALILFAIIPYQIDKPLIVVTGSVANLPAELFPQMVAVAFLFLGIWLAVTSFSIHQVNELRNLDKEAIVNVSVTLVLMAIYVPVMVSLGFVVGSAIMVFAMSTYFGNRNFVTGAIISIVLPMFMFFIFRRVLLVELPPFPVDIYPLTNWSLI